AFVTLAEFEPLADCTPKSWPLVPAKSIAPSKALALKVLLVELLVTTAENPWPVSISVPESVAVIVDGAPSRLSTLIWLATVPALMMSTESSGPSDGSNCGTCRPLARPLAVLGTVTVLGEATGTEQHLPHDAHLP